MSDHFQKIFRSIGVVCMIVIAGCTMFQDPGSSNDTAGTPGGYFYLLERSTVSIIMLDDQLKELRRWNLLTVTNGDSSMQGITCDGKYLWYAAAGGVDRIYQLDLSGTVPSVIKSFDAPPRKSGTVRDIAWDGNQLRVINSGSSTYHTPPMLFSVNASNGSIIDSVVLPSGAPRALTFVPVTSDVYGRGVKENSLYYTDVVKNKIYSYTLDIPLFDTVFSSPVPPRGADYTFPAGLTFDGSFFWLINSSTNADHLYQLNSSGKVQTMYDLPYPEPGPVVWSMTDVRIPEELSILAVSPSTALRGASVTVDVYGKGFRPSIDSVSFGADVKVSMISYLDPTRLTISLSISAGAVLGKRDITVYEQSGRRSTGVQLFEVTALPAPVGYLYLADQGLSLLYKIRISDTTVVKQWATNTVSSGSPQGLAYDGTSVWLSTGTGDKKIYKLDTSAASLSASSSFIAPDQSGLPRGMAWDGSALWVIISPTNATTGTLPRSIYKISASGAVLDSIQTPGTQARGIAFANGQLYCNDKDIDSVFVWDAAPKRWRSVFATPTPSGGSSSDRYATGMVWDGSNFWIANSTGSFDIVYKVSITGVVLQSFRAPAIGTAQLTGIAFSPN